MASTEEFERAGYVVRTGRRLGQIIHRRPPVRSLLNPPVNQPLYPRFFIAVNIPPEGPLTPPQQPCRFLLGSTIVMLTAAVGDEAEREAEDAGADLFLTKPFSPLELLRLVHGLGDGSATG